MINMRELSRFYDKLLELLRICSNLSNNLRVRDRSVKILQYSCQMLLAIYGAHLSDGFSQALQLLRKTASTSRKAFWLLRSFEHINRCLLLINALCRSGISLSICLSLWEEVSLAFYFYTENLVFLSRMQLLSVPESSLDYWANAAWLSADLAAFTCTVLRLDVHGGPGIFIDALGAALDVAVAGRYVGLWHLAEAETGLCGAASASLSLVRAAQKM